MAEMKSRLLSHYSGKTKAGGGSLDCTRLFSKRMWSISQNKINQMSALWEAEEERQKVRREPGVAGVSEAKEERVSRKKGWSVTMQPIQKVDRWISRVDRFSRAGEPGRLAASKTLWLESACFCPVF